MLDEAIARVRAYAEAGASGFFVPMLGDLELVEPVCGESPVPVNFMTYPGCPANAEMGGDRVARISHGPFPFMALMAAMAGGGSAGGARLGGLPFRRCHGQRRDGPDFSTLRRKMADGDL